MPTAQMALSWSLVEVPRYAFYLNTLLGPGGQKGTVYPIFWLRYSLFAILYPTGISGEVLTLLACLGDAKFALAWGGVAAVLVKVVLALYVPASPFMYMNMVGNRKGAFKKRFAPPPAPPKAPVGAEFPEDGKGGRSTSEAGKKVIAAALAGAGTPEGEEASAKCAKERNWRFGYNKHIVKLARVGCASHPALAFTHNGPTACMARSERAGDTRRARASSAASLPALLSTRPPSLLPHPTPRRSCASPSAAKGTAAAGLKWMYDNMVYHSADQKLAGAFGATVDKVPTRPRSPAVPPGGPPLFWDVCSLVRSRTTSILGLSRGASR